MYKLSKKAAITLKGVFSSSDKMSTSRTYPLENKDFGFPTSI